MASSLHHTRTRHHTHASALPQHKIDLCINNKKIAASNNNIKSQTEIF